MSNDTTASASTDLDELAKRYASYVTGSVVTLPATELHAVAAALARAPLPALADDEVYTLRCAAENMRSADAENSATIVDARFRLASKLEKIANRLSADPAQADEARDAARFHFIEEHATMHGGGNGFTITCFVGVDEEDMGVGIDKMIAASLAGKDKP